MDILDLKNKVTTIIDSSNTISNKLQAICDLLFNDVAHYDWVGFYFANQQKKELHLAEFSGEPTEHTVIPFGRGICGQVAVSNKNFVVPNVSEQDNYISCGWKVKSEIVIPIFVNGKNIGQIDIDSHLVDPFSENDTILLEFVCENVAKLY